MSRSRLFAQASTKAATSVLLNVSGGDCTRRRRTRRRSTTGRPVRSPRSQPEGTKRNSRRMLNTSAERASANPREAQNRANSTTTVKIPSTVPAERHGPIGTTVGSAARRRLRPRRCLRLGVRSNHRAKDANSSTAGADSSTSLPAAQVNHNARRPA